MITFGDLEDGEVFDLANPKHRMGRYIKCLEMAGNGNAVNYDNSRQTVMIPAHVEVVRLPNQKVH